MDYGEFIVYSTLNDVLMKSLPMTDNDTDLVFGTARFRREKVSDFVSQILQRLSTKFNSLFKNSCL